MSVVLLAIILTGVTGLTAAASQPSSQAFKWFSKPNRVCSGWNFKPNFDFEAFSETRLRRLSCGEHFDQSSNYKVVLTFKTNTSDVSITPEYRWQGETGWFIGRYHPPSSYYEQNFTLIGQGPVELIAEVSCLGDESDKQALTVTYEVFDCNVVEKQYIIKIGDFIDSFNCLRGVDVFSPRYIWFDGDRRIHEYYKILSINRGITEPAIYRCSTIYEPPVYIAGLIKHEIILKSVKPVIPAKNIKASIQLLNGGQSPEDGSAKANLVVTWRDENTAINGEPKTPLVEYVSSTGIIKSATNIDVSQRPNCTAVFEDVDPKINYLIRIKHETSAGSSEPGFDMVLSDQTG